MTIDLHWSVPPRLWHRRRVFILAGGPSLRGFDADVLPGDAAVLAIKNAYTIAPWADAMFWADRSWVSRGHVETIPPLWQGGLLVTRLPPCLVAVQSWPIKVLRHDRRFPLSRDPGAISGWCSGANAINLAFLAGASEIVLLGFDGRNSGNWHDEKKAPTPPEAYGDTFIPALTAMAGELQKERVRVFNATPDSALTCFPCRRLEDFL